MKMRIAFLLAVFALFGESFGRVKDGPTDSELYGYGILRRLCNYESGASKMVRLDGNIFETKKEGEGEGAKVTRVFSDAGKKLVKDLRDKNPGLNRGIYSKKDKAYSRPKQNVAKNIETGLTNENMYELYDGLFTLADKPISNGALADGIITVDELIEFLETKYECKETEIEVQVKSSSDDYGNDALQTEKIDKIVYTLTPTHKLLAKFIAAIADDTGDGHLDANEFTCAVMADGALPYTASVIMFRFMDFRKDTGSNSSALAGDWTNADRDNHSLIHVTAVAQWLLSGTSFADGVGTTFFMPITA